MRFRGKSAGGGSGGRGGEGRSEVHRAEEVDIFEMNGLEYGREVLLEPGETGDHILSNSHSHTQYFANSLISSEKRSEIRGLNPSYAKIGEQTQWQGDQEISISGLSERDDNGLGPQNFEVRKDGFGYQNESNSKTHSTRCLCIKNCIRFWRTKRSSQDYMVETEMGIDLRYLEETPSFNKNSHGL